MYSYTANDQLEKETSDPGGLSILVSYLYDDNGSLTQADNGTVTVYTYNLQNRLDSVTVGANPAVTYKYNSDGIRVRSYYYKTINGGNPQNEETKLFLIDAYNHTGYAQVLEQWPDGGTIPDVTYTIGDDIITEKRGAGPARKHLLYDGLGSVRQTVYHGGSVAEAYSYDAYGVMLGGNPDRSSPAATNLLYAGEQFDTDAQLKIPIVDRLRLSTISANWRRIGGNVGSGAVEASRRNSLLTLLFILKIIS